LISSPGGPKATDRAARASLSPFDAGSKCLAQLTAFGLLGGERGSKVVAVSSTLRDGALGFDAGHWKPRRGRRPYVAVKPGTTRQRCVQRWRQRFAWIDYDGTTQRMSIYVSQTNDKPATATVVTPVDERASGERSLNIGFTAASSNATNVRHFELGLPAATPNSD
jgi:hypothetical protein